MNAFTNRHYIRSVVFHRGSLCTKNSRMKGIFCGDRVCRQGSDCVFPLAISFGFQTGSFVVVHRRSGRHCPGTSIVVNTEIIIGTNRDCRGLGLEKFCTLMLAQVVSAIYHIISSYFVDICIVYIYTDRKQRVFIHSYVSISFISFPCDITGRTNVCPA